MAVSGLPTKCNTHAHYVAKLALDMMDACRSILIRGKPFKVTVTINYIARIIAKYFLVLLDQFIKLTAKLLERVFLTIVLHDAILVK